jgi:hypothetical protein
MNLGNRKGSTMLEFALLAPVVAALLAGFVGVSMTFLRTLQADQLCRKAVEMAVGGVDLDLAENKALIFNLYGGKSLEDRQGVLYVTHIVRDAGGYRKIKSYEIGKIGRWESSADTGSPEQVIELEPGEDAWVSEIWLDNHSILSSVTPNELHARSVL